MKSRNNTFDPETRPAVTEEKVCVWWMMKGQQMLPGGYKCVCVFYCIILQLGIGSVYYSHFHRKSQTFILVEVKDVKTTWETSIHSCRIWKNSLAATSYTTSVEWLWTTKACNNSNTKANTSIWKSIKYTKIYMVNVLVLFLDGQTKETKRPPKQNLSWKNK